MMNAYRLVADLCHLLAIVILPIQIHRKQSCAGVSGKTQILFAMVFVARYADLMVSFVSTYNSVMKVAFIVLTFYTLYLIYVRYNDTHDSAKDSFRFEFLIVIALALGLLYNHEFETLEVLWTFSIYLEAIAIIPQIYMFHTTRDLSVFPSHYVFLIGLYRGLYILNWIWRYGKEGWYDPIAVGAGVIQTAIYLDFFYVYMKNKRSMGMEKMHTVVV